MTVSPASFLLFVQGSGALRNRDFFPIRPLCQLGIHGLKILDLRLCQHSARYATSIKTMRPSFARSAMSAKSFIQPRPPMVLTASVRKGRWLLFGLLGPLGLVAGFACAEPAGPPSQDAAPRKQEGPFEVAQVELPPAIGRSGSVTIDIAIDSKAAIGMERTPYWVLFAAGVASVPLAVLNPFYGLGVLYPIVGTPINAVFNARRDTLAAAVKAEPLPEKMLAILTELLDAERTEEATGIRVRISSYGLVPKSGRTAGALTAGDELCLAAHAVLTISREGAQPVESKIVVGMEGQDPEAPPPVCASIAHFSRDDGIYLRQSIRELAEVLSAIILHRLKSPS
jgi:hypothetical protein